MNDNIETFSYKYILWSFFLGLLFYDAICTYLNFKYVDEILSCILLFEFFTIGKFTKEIWIFAFIYFFYLFYSLFFGVAKYQAVIIDAIIYIKPFVGFYTAYVLGMHISEPDKAIIKKIIIGCCVVIFLLSLIIPKFQLLFFGHQSRYATFFQVSGFLYYYCSERRREDIVVSLIMWSCALLSFRSKSYGFFAAAITLFYFLRNKRIVEIGYSVILYIPILCSVILYAAWTKVESYITVGTNDDYTQSYARPALYQASIFVMSDYFPFGPGFGSYGSFASSEYYSPLYEEYGLDAVWGLSEDMGSFICDTFFPQLTQFGVAGVFLFVFFFLIRFKEIKFLFYDDDDMIKMNLLVIFFFIIESVVDSTFVQNRGMVMLMVWGMLISEKKYNLR